MKTSRQLRSGEDLIQLAIRLGLLAFLIYWTFVLIRPFVPILAWSIVLAVALYPVFNLLSRLLGGRPRLAAAILTVINLGIVIGPATWLGLSAVEGVKDFAANLSAGNLMVPSPPDGVKNWPLIGPQLFELWNQASNNIRAALREVAPHLKPLAGTMLGLAGNAGVGTLKFLLSVALAGFLFPYGSQLVAAGRAFLYRIVPEQSEHFLELAGTTIRAVSQGVIGVAIIQSLLAGIGFKLAGIPGAGLLAFMVMILTIVQIGAAIVLVPVIIWIWIDKDFTTALLLDGVPGHRRHTRQHLETALDGARPDDADDRHPRRGDRRNTRAWHCRSLHRTDHSLRGLGIDGRLDTHRSCRRDVAGPTFER